MHENLLILVGLLKLVQPKSSSEKPICVLGNLVIRDGLVIGLDAFLSVHILKLAPVDASLHEIIMGHDAEHRFGT